MASVPEGWPPTPLLPERVVVPLFPLADVWLLTREVKPLHVFEERYKQMVEDSLDGPGRLVLGTVVPEHVGEMEGAPPIHPVAGLGEIGRHDRLGDGRFAIFLFGLARVRVSEVESDAPYRMVEAEPLEDVPASPAEEEALREALVEAVIASDKRVEEIPDEVPLGALADWLLMRTSLEHDVFHGLFAELDVAKRARGVLGSRS